MQPLFLFYSKLNKYILAFSFEPNYFGTTFFSLSLNPYFALRNLCTVYFWTTTIKKLKFYISLEQTDSLFHIMRGAFFHFHFLMSFSFKIHNTQSNFFFIPSREFSFLIFFYLSIHAERFSLSIIIIYYFFFTS